MKKETKAAIAKFGVKLALKYTGAELLGDAAEIVAGVGEKILPETTKNFLEAFSDTTADFFSDKAGDLTSKYLTKGELYVNFHLARGICKVWEDALTESLPKNRAANSKYFLLPQDSFQDFNNELEFFIEKFKLAQIEGNESLLVELFYDKNKSETSFYETFFEGAQDEKTAEEAYWTTLKKTLIVWATREGKFRYEWKNDFPEEFKRELKKFFFGNLRYGLREIFDKNEQFRNAFNFSVELITFDLIKKLPEKIRDDIENAQSENRFYYSQLQARFSNIEDNIEAVSEAVQTKFTQSWNPKVLDNLLSESQKQTSFQERIVIATEKIANNPFLFIKATHLPKRIASDSFPSHTNYFTGRDDVLKNIKYVLEKYKRAALYGISGLGKTTVALEFAKREENSYTNIFFLHATRNNTLSNFASLAEKISESAKNLEKDINKATKFKIWLEENDNWLLIIDNVDVPSEVLPLLPINFRGHILTTGNSRDITVLGHQVEIKKMTAENAELLIYRRSKTLFDYTDTEIKNYFQLESQTKRIAVKNMVKEFDGLPLALNLAGAYIHKFKKQFIEYFELYQVSANKLLEKQDVNDQYQNNSVAKAFSLAFEEIATPQQDTIEAKQIADTAVLFLKTASFMNPEAIPLEIFPLILAKQNTIGEKLSQDDLFLDEVLAKISQFDLFEKDSDENTVNIHRLVQIVIENKIEDKEKQWICSQMLNILAEMMPRYDYFNKKICERYFRQIETLLKNVEKLNLINQKTKTLYNRIGQYQYLSGNYQQAEKFHFHHWKIAESLYGKNHQETAQSLNNLALVYREQGRYDEAINKYKEALKIAENTIGKDHVNYADHLNNLALVYYSQGRFEEAIKIFEEALNIDEKTVGKEHPQYAKSLNNLASVYHSQERYEEVIEIFEEALIIRKKTLGVEHPDYAQSLNNLAFAHDSQGNYANAIPMYEEAVEIFYKYLGENHPWTQTAKDNLDKCNDIIDKK